MIHDDICSTSVGRLLLSTAAPEEFSFADIDSGATDLATYEWEGPYQLNVPIQNPSKWQNWLFAINSSHSWRHCINYHLSQQEAVINRFHCL